MINNPKFVCQCDNLECSLSITVVIEGITFSPGSPLAYLPATNEPVLTKLKDKGWIVSGDNIYCKEECKLTEPLHNQIVD